MYSRILVAVDGSAGAARALNHAIALARAFKASLRIVHVVDMGWLPLGPELAVDVKRMADARCAGGERILATAREAAQAAEVAAETRLLETMTPGERVAETISGEAAAWPAELIALGAHGHGRIEHLLLGSVADGVARRAQVPVLLVHA